MISLFVWFRFLWTQSGKNTYPTVILVEVRYYSFGQTLIGSVSQ